MKSLGEYFTHSFLKHLEKKAITFFRGSKIETEISYGELNRDSNLVASTFRDWGVEKGDRVILYVPKSLFSVVAYIALQKIGAVAVPLNPGFKKTEMSYYAKDADAKLLLCGLEQGRLLKEIDFIGKQLIVDTRKPYQDLDFFRSSSEELFPADTQPDDPGLIIYTSGTTGNPKGAILTQNNLVQDTKNVLKIWEISDSDILCHALPLFHLHGLGFALNTCLMAGSSIMMLDRFSPESVLEVLSNKVEGPTCTVFMAVPSMYKKLLDLAQDKDLSFTHMRLWTSGSAPLLPKDFYRIKEVFGKEPVEREGMSETGMNFSNPLKGIRKPGSIGLPLPNVQVSIVDPETFHDVKLCEIGEIWLKGPNITPGYWRKPEETEKAFVTGWFRTGDLGRADKDGYYYITDRIKHIIISGGENISPKEIQSVINRLEGVIESSVVGIPDERWGEMVVAAVVVNVDSRLKHEDIKAHCKKYLHDWKCPKEVIFLSELPKNTMGKVLNKEVKRQVITALNSLKTN